MTSIAVKLEQRIQELKKQKSQDPPSKINYMEHYLNYVIVRSTARGVFCLFGNSMIRKSGNIDQKGESLEIALYIFAGISLYFSFHGLCCFDELKVIIFEIASNLEKGRHEILDSYQSDFLNHEK